jgi:hypothetical protein
MGPYTRQALDEHRAAAESGAHVVGPRGPRAELTLHFYETVGVLYAAAEHSDLERQRETGLQGDEDGTAVQTFAELLHDVRVALASPGGPTALALTEALRRYERDRTGGRS